MNTVSNLLMPTTGLLLAGYFAYSVLAWIPSIPTF